MVCYIKMKILFAIAVLFIADCKGSYYYNLVESFGIDPDSPRQGTKVEGGPDGKGKVLVFGPDAAPVYLKGPSPAYMITALSASSDFTYYTEFKMPPRDLAKDEKWVFFSLLGATGTNVFPYFSVGLKKRSTGGAGAEDTSEGGKLVQILFVSQDKAADADLIMKEEFKPNTWYKLSIRIRPSSQSVVNVRKRRSTSALVGQVRVNCKVIGTLNFEKSFKDLVPFGYAVYGSSLKSGSDPPTAVENRFPGPLAGGVLINGLESFNLYSPCDSNFKTQEIPSEPRPNEYSDKNLQKFLRAMSGVSLRVSLTCPGTKPVKYRGESWKVGRCEYYKCNKNGEVEMKYGCKQCTDPATGKKYPKGAKWIDSQNKCREITCDLGFDDFKYRDIKATCKSLTKDDCGGYEPLKLKDECCLKCGNETCTKGKDYYQGCKKQCEDAPDFTCKETKVGCWCPQGSVENAEGECINIGECPCRSGSVVYQPGQSAIRSSCSSCVCNRGEMVCFNTC